MRRSAPIAYYDIPGVEPHADGEAEPALAAEVVHVAAELRAEMQRRVVRPLRVILVRHRRAEDCHDAVARDWFTVPSKRWTPSARTWKRRSMMRCQSSGSSCSASSIDPFTSAKSTVTCLPSPSRAAFEWRIFAARCCGV